MLSCKFRQLVTLDHLEASVATHDFVEDVGETLLSERLVALHESLLLAWVKDDNAWHLSFLQLEDGSELRLKRNIQATVAEGDTALNVAGEVVFDVINGIEESWVTLGRLRHNINHTKDALLLKTEVICTFLAKECDIL